MGKSLDFELTNVSKGGLIKGGSLLNTPLIHQNVGTYVFRVFMNAPPEYFEYSDCSTEYSA